MRRSDYRVMKKGAGVLAVMGFMVWLAAGTQAGMLVLSHSGDTDPTLENWTLVASKPDLHSGEAVDDGGTAAWKIQDSEAISSGGGSWNYRGDGALSAQELNDLTTNGWAFRANLRVDDFATSGYDETAGLTPGVQIAFETEHDPGSGDATAGLWILFGLGSDANGDTTYSLRGGYPFSPTITGTISGSDYNSYEIVWEPDTNTIDVYVNSAELVSDYDVATNSFANALGNRLFWGSMDSPGVGAGYWNSVEFEIVPEPASVVVLITAICGLAFLRQRRG